MERLWLRTPRRDGFTLVEILVVIVIIGLLASITLVALGGARGLFSNVTAKTRLDDVAKALEAYKQKYGEYPPDSNATDAEIRRHILKRWPKVLKTQKIAEMIEFAEEIGDASPGKALLFWFAGPDAEGFAADDEYPFGDFDGVDFAIAPDEPRETPTMELSYSSEGKGGNYNDLGLMFQGQTIAYFRADGSGSYHGKDFHVESGNIAAPYMKNKRWLNPDSFQVILPGEDGLYGADPFGDEGHGEHAHAGGAAHAHGSDPDCADYVARDLANSDTTSVADRDNVTNFSTGATLEADFE